MNDVSAQTSGMNLKVVGDQCVVVAPCRTQTILSLYENKRISYINQY